MLEMTKPPSESQVEVAWVSKIHFWGFVAEENNQPD
jgi:hypothetical protein